MKDHITKVKKYTLQHKKKFVIGALVAGVSIIVVALLFISSNMTRIVYQPTKACELLTEAEAQELLGGKTISSNISSPVVSNDTAVSKCGYTDRNPDVNSMIVAAIIVRSGINDAGVAQNKTEFVKNRPKEGTDTVKGFGDRAYYNQKLGQLNILDERNWIILSYGVGSTPESNTLEKSVELANKVVN